MKKLFKSFSLKSLKKIDGIVIDVIEAVQIAFPDNKELCEKLEALQNNLRAVNQIITDIEL